MLEGMHIEGVPRPNGIPDRIRKVNRRIKESGVEKKIIEILVGSAEAKEADHRVNVGLSTRPDAQTRRELEAFASENRKPLIEPDAKQRYRIRRERGNSR